MAERQTIARSKRAKRQGKSPSTQAGEFVREEMHHIREGKHGARSTKQAIAIGLSKARRSGVAMGPPEGGSAQTRSQARRDMRSGRSRRRPARTRSRAVTAALRREGHGAASRRSLARHAHTAAQRRGPQARRRAAQKAVRTKGPGGLRRAAHKAVRTRERHRSGSRR